MTIEEAERIAIEYYQNEAPTEEDDFLYVEALKFLIDEKQDPEDMMVLGGWYYKRREFDLALKYYEMAASYGSDEADECLGYIWYYGRTGKRDFKKAFEHYYRSMEKGNLVSTYKIADMYKDGYYVDQNYEYYKQIIEALYKKVKDAEYLDQPLPEVFTRLAKIRVQQKRIDEAIELLLEARNFLRQRIVYNAFFGDLTIMKYLIDDLYDLLEFDDKGMELYDLFYVLKHSVKVVFYYRKDQKQEIETFPEGTDYAVCFNGTWYRDRDEFFEKAEIDGRRIIYLYAELHRFEVTFKDGDH